jgi:hypothetical protein
MMTVCSAGKVSVYLFLLSTTELMNISCSISIVGEISGYHGGEKMTVFWDVAPCSLVEVYRRFRGAFCNLPDDGGSKHL